MRKQIIKAKYSDSLFIFSEERVTKIFPIESGLHYDVAIRLLDYYKKIGISIDYDIILMSGLNDSYFITNFPKLNVVKDSDSLNEESINKNLTSILSENPIPVLEMLKERLGIDNILICVRDIKPSNFFRYNGEIYLLDIADFFFVCKTEGGGSYTGR